MRISHARLFLGASFVVDLERSSVFNDGERV